MGKSTISMAIFNSYVLNYQRVSGIQSFIEFQFQFECCNYSYIGHIPVIGLHIHFLYYYEYI